MIQWIDKHKPERMEDLVGQGKAVKEIMQWFQSRPPGKALFIYGPTGCGKTSSIEAYASGVGYSILRVSTSESNYLEEIKSALESSKSMTLFSRGKIILFDDLDGISSRDRGAAGEIAGLIKESKFPVVLIANDPWIPKLKSLRAYSTMVKFSKPMYPSIAKLIKEIGKKEGIEVEDSVAKNLARWCRGDVRSAINDFQTASTGRNMLTNEDLSVLGFREKEVPVFDVMATVFKSRSFAASRKSIIESDKDSDEILWWIENNMANEYSGDQLAEAFDMLSRADVFRGLVSKQQNWRFKAYMVDTMAGVSLVRKESEHGSGFFSYQPPKRFIQMGATKVKREEKKKAMLDIGKKLHCSKSGFLREYLPYLRIMYKNDANPLNLDKEEAKLLFS